MKSGKNSKSKRNQDLLSRPIGAKEIHPDGLIEEIDTDASDLYREYPGFERQVAQLNRRILKLVACHSRPHEIGSQYGDESVERISFLATMKAFFGLRQIERIEKCFPALSKDGIGLKTRFLKSLELPEAATQFLNVFHYSEDRRKTRGVREEDLLNRTTPVLLNGMTNELIFTGSVSESISSYSSCISKRAELGDASFFVQFGDWVERATAGDLVITFERWLLNHWLPLALWTLSPTEALTLLRDYAKLIQSRGRPAPILGKDEEVKKNIRRFKMRLISAERK